MCDLKVKFIFVVYKGAVTIVLKAIDTCKLIILMRNDQYKGVTGKITPKVRKFVFAITFKLLVVQLCTK